MTRCRVLLTVMLGLAALAVSAPAEATPAGPCTSATVAWQLDDAGHHVTHAVVAVPACGEPTVGLALSVDGETLPRGGSWVEEIEDSLATFDLTGEQLPVAAVEGVSLMLGSQVLHQSLDGRDPAGGVGAGARGESDGDVAGSLPLTGAAIWLLLLLAAVLVGTGIVLRRLGRHRIATRRA